MVNEFSLHTEKEGFYDITSNVNKIIHENKIVDGICIVFCPHTTAGITINENADPDVVTDMLFALDKTLPDRLEFRHFEGNTTAHLKASYVGSSATVIVKNGKPLLGRWQGIYFCEFDGPRIRTYFIKTLSS